MRGLAGAALDDLQVDRLLITDSGRLSRSKTALRISELRAAGAQPADVRAGLNKCDPDDRPTGVRTDVVLAERVSKDTNAYQS